MMHPSSRLLGLVALALGAAGCQPAKPPAPPEAAGPDLTGEWRAHLQFSSGAFASIKDLEFMYAFNQGGTMTESSNYDATPPVPPAYGVWKRVGPGQFEAKYEFYVTRAPAKAADLMGGWLPAGRGVFVEQITLSSDGNSFTSKIHYDQFDATGKPAEGGGEATGSGTRLAF